MGLHTFLLLLTLRLAFLNYPLILPSVHLFASPDSLSLSVCPPWYQYLLLQWALWHPIQTGSVSVRCNYTHRDSNKALTDIKDVLLWYSLNKHLIIAIDSTQLTCFSYYRELHLEWYASVLIDFVIFKKEND